MIQDGQTTSTKQFFEHAYHQDIFNDDLCISGETQNACKVDARAFGSCYLLVIFNTSFLISNNVLLKKADVTPQCVELSPCLLGVWLRGECEEDHGMLWNEHPMDFTVQCDRLLLHIVSHVYGALQCSLFILFLLYFSE